MSQNKTASWKPCPALKISPRLNCPTALYRADAQQFQQPIGLPERLPGCGSMFDPPEKLGLANFTASVPDARHRTPFLSGDLRKPGIGWGQPGVWRRVHNVSFGGRALAEDLPLLLGLLSETLRQPVFPANSSSACAPRC
jgi:hypothetical protein